jgi:hypothetical protein
MIKRLGDAVCGLHRTRRNEEREFSGLASKPSSMVCQWFGLKTPGTVSFGLASKPVAMVFFGLASKPVAMVFFGLASKPVATVSFGLATKPWLSLKVKVVEGFLVWASKPVAMVW